MFTIQFQELVSHYKSGASGVAGDGRMCPVCGRVFPFPSEVVKHMRIHTGDRPYPCPMCDHRSRYKGDMTRHIVHVHKMDKDDVLIYMKKSKNFQKFNINFMQ